MVWSSAHLKGAKRRTQGHGRTAGVTKPLDPFELPGCSVSLQLVVQDVAIGRHERVAYLDRPVI